MRLAFTGHRWYEGQAPSGLKDTLKAELWDLNSSKGVITAAYSGMAIGFDMMAAEACLDLGIPLIACLPFRGQEVKWPRQVQQRWASILTRAAEVHIVSPGGYAPWKMQVRNAFMVDHADLVMAYYRGTPGGTANCIAYAESKGRPIVNLAERIP